MTIIGTQSKRIRRNEDHHVTITLYFPTIKIKQAKGIHCQLSMIMIDPRGKSVNQYIGVKPKNPDICANTPYIGFIIMCFQSNAFTVGITKKGEINKILTKACPGNGLLINKAIAKPKPTVITTTLNNRISVLITESVKAGFVMKKS